MEEVIAISKRPFNGALYRLGIAIGVLVAFAFILPRSFKGGYLSGLIFHLSFNSMWQESVVFP